MPASLRAITTPVGRFVTEAERQTVEWVVAQGLVADYGAAAPLHAMKPALLAAHCYPIADAGQMNTLANWHSWLFLLDDRNDEGSLGRSPDAFEPELATVYDAAFHGDGAVNANPLGRGLADIWDQVGRTMPPAWRRRFQRHVSDYFAASVWQAAHRSLEQVPRLNTFKEMRRNAGAIWPSFDLVEWVAGAALLPSVYFSPCYQTLLTAAADVVCWTNDLLTLDKELAHSDTQNLIAVINHDRGGALQDAIDEVVRRSDERITDFLAAEQALPCTMRQLGCPMAQQVLASSCTAMLRAWMRGHVDWGMQTARYWLREQVWAEAI